MDKMMQREQLDWKGDGVADMGVLVWTGEETEGISRISQPALAGKGSSNSLTGVALVTLVQAVEKGG